MDGGAIIDGDTVASHPVRNWKTIPVPEAIRTLPRDFQRGFPIIFTQTPPVEGWEPDSAAPHDFRIVYVERVEQCGRDRLCGVCGGKLGYWIAFVGGPLSVESRSFTDPPMHPDCAEYAVQVCPYMVARAVPRREEGSTGPIQARYNNTGGTREKPDRWGLYLTRDFTLTNGAREIYRRDPQLRGRVRAGDGERVNKELAPYADSLMFAVAPAKRVRWFRDGEEVPA